ncbi:MAG: ribonuclease P protein component [Chloroflexi bacterium OHK40]
MKRVYRLRRPEQFRRARREGRTYTTPLLTLNVVAGRRRRTRCGFVVARQIGTAVRRNRARRRLREAVRLALPAIRPGFDLVFVARGPEVLSVSFPVLQQAVEQLLRRAQLWHEPAPPAVQAALAPEDEARP